jgi:hypothetical protein
VNSSRFGRNVANSVLLPVILGQIAARFVPEQLFRTCIESLVAVLDFRLSGLRRLDNYFPDPTINPSKERLVMPDAQEDRSVLEVRALLAQQGTKDVVINYYINRGMDPDEASEMVVSIYKENLSINRKSSLGVLIGGGIGTAILSAIWIGTGRLFILWLPICAIAFLWGFVKFIMASGYEVDDDD